MDPNPDGTLCHLIVGPRGVDMATFSPERLRQFYVLSERPDGEWIDGYARSFSPLRN